MSFLRNAVSGITSMVSKFVPAAEPPVKASRSKPHGNTGRAKKSEPVDLLQPESAEAPYPIDALGTIGKAVTEAVITITQAPPALCAQSCLAALSMIASGRVDVQTLYGETRPCTLNLKSIAKSGERKSTVDGMFLRGIRQFEEELRYAHRVQFAKHMEKDEPRGAPPLTGSLFIEDPTYEGLLRILGENRGYAGLFNADAADFIKGAGMSDDNKLKFAAGLSRLWDGSPIVRARQGGGETFINRKRVSVHLQFQPAVAAGFIDDRLLDGQGFFARALISWPTSTMGARPFRHATAAAQADIAKFAAWSYQMLLPAPDYLSGSRNDLDPRILKLSPKAADSWIRFHDEVESQIGSAGRYAAIEAFAAKAAEHALRLAGVLTWSIDQHATEIKPETIDQGITLARYYIGEMLRLRTAGAADPRAGELGRLLAWISKRDKNRISSEEINHGGPTEFRNDWRKVRGALDELAARNHLRLVKTWKTKSAEHAEYEVAAGDA